MRRKIIEFAKSITLQETRDLLISTLIISIIISLNTIKDFISRKFYFDLCIMFLIVFPSFVLHELSHKLTAVKYKMYAQFEISYYGLLISLILKLLLGVTIIVPGAVVIYRSFFHRSNRRDRAIEGIIASAGPAANFVIGVISYFLFSLFSSGFLSSIMYSLAYVNILLLVFNLLPIPPLDGFKIARWSIPIYLAFFILSLSIFFIFF